MPIASHGPPRRNEGRQAGIIHRPTRRQGTASTIMYLLYSPIARTRPAAAHQPALPWLAARQVSHTKPSHATTRKGSGVVTVPSATKNGQTAARPAAHKPARPPNSSRASP